MRLPQGLTQGLKGFAGALVTPFRRRMDISFKQGLAVAPLWGGLAALALPPLYLLPLGLLGLAAWFRLVAWATCPRHAFCLGGLFAFGYFLGGLWWIAFAFQYESGLLAWAGFPLVVLLAAGLSLFWAVASAGARFARQGVARVLLFTAAVLAAELARGFVLGGFPWNPIASFWAGSAVTLQPLALFGSDLWSALTVFACAAAVSLVYDGKAGSAGAGEVAGKGEGKGKVESEIEGKGEGEGKVESEIESKGEGESARVRVGRYSSIAVLVLAVVLPPATLLISGAQVAVAPPAQEVAGVRLRLVQPAIAQEDKWKRAQRRKNLNLQYQLLTTAGNFTHAILPEATVAWPLNTAATVRSLLTSALPQEGSLIIGGITRLNHQQAEAVPRLHNSLYVLDSTGAISARYDKHRLVPFGEFIPFSRWLPATRLTNAEGVIDYTPGDGLRTLVASSGARVSVPPFSPLICFEVLFSGRVVQHGTDRASWLVNLTNDAWFGQTSGPYQHFAAARMRAVEEGLPLVRSANNGISAVIDGRGRIQSLLPLGARGVLDANLPQALPPTGFARFGLRLPLVALAFFAVAFLIAQLAPPVLRRP